MYAELLGENWPGLPAALHAIHESTGRRTWRGEVDVRAGSGLLARLFAVATRLPARYAGPIEVEIVAEAATEQWTRRFGAHTMRSRLRSDNGLLRERLGPVRFHFVLAAAGGTIRWHVARVHVCGLPLPSSWCARSSPCRASCIVSTYAPGCPSSV